MFLKRLLIGVGSCFSHVCRMVGWSVYVL